MSDQDPTKPAPYKLTPEHRRVFIGLMLGMLVASVSQTIVGPALPIVVAELGGIAHYSWVATAAMLVSAVAVPIVGKLSDLYGRRGFYLGGIAVFIVGSLVCGLAPNFWVLVAGRAIQGLGMGILMPLSQTIIGDIVPARQRGKYQGVMGSVFGVTAIAGPLAGGVITDSLGWRWLFFASIPISVIALFFIARFMRLEHERQEARIDFAGMLTLSGALVCILLATSWGGTTYPWTSPTILVLYAVGAVLTVLFVFAERRADEPVIPLRLFRNKVFTMSNLASFAVSMVMFGAIIYIPIYAQGVFGVNATESGLILVPLMLGMIVMGMVTGWLITKTGHYKEFMLLGVVLMGLGVWLLTRLGYGSSPISLTIAMIVFGVGLGLALQQYTLVVQNAATRRDLGVATASTQFFRNVGSTVGIALFGTIMTSGLGDAIARYLPGGAPSGAPDIGAGSVLDPAVLATLPPEVEVAVRHGLADQLHNVFLVALPVVVVALVFTMLIKAFPLRDTVHTGEESGREMLDTLSQSAHDADDIVPGFANHDVGARTRERLLGFQFAMFARQAVADDRPLLRRAVEELGGGDIERGRALLQRTSEMLTTEDPRVIAHAEKYAADLADRAKRGVMSNDLRQEVAVAATSLSRDEVLSNVEPTVAERVEAFDPRLLRSAASDLGAAFLVDIARAAQARDSADQP